jgi:hypothetical protein
MTGGLLFSSLSNAVDFDLEFLYWQPSETIDWAVTNNKSLPNQIITYKTIDFDFAPGFRLGAQFEKETFNGRVYYTWLNSRGKDAVNGNVISAYMPSKFAEDFYQSGQVRFNIDFDSIDADLIKTIPIEKKWVLNPYIGIKAARIDQSITTQYLGTILVIERVKNDFLGIGPKIGIEGSLPIYQGHRLNSQFVADFSTALMWGTWSINDTMTQSNSSLISSVDIANRNLGALEVQGFVGLRLTHERFSVKAGYEVSDWFNQYQLFDNATGSHSNDLVFQGLSLQFLVQDLLN